MNQLPPNLLALNKYPQFLNAQGKIPVAPAGHNIDPHNPINWMSFDNAKNAAELMNLNIGFAFTSSDPYWFLDIDDAYVDGDWSDIAKSLCAVFKGAAVEISQSGKGLHIFGTGQIPDHSCKNKEHKIEFYHDGRFVLLTGTHATGNINLDCSDQLRWLVDNYFPPGDSSESAWTSEPVPDWNGPTNDDELLQKMLNSCSAKSAFSGRATFRDLWENNESVLATNYPALNDKDPYDRSSADMALASHIAWWTGKNCERIRRLMNMSALVRPKWTKNKKYLTGTITNGVNGCQDVYSSRNPKKSKDTGATTTKPVIDIFPAKLNENLHSAIHALSAINPPIVFQRGQMLVRVGRTKELSDAYGCSIPSGSANIISVQKASLLAKLDQAATWQKFSKSQDDWIPADPCPKVNAALFESAGEWGEIPSLFGISEVPLIKPDGTMLTTPGFDPGSQIYIDGDFCDLQIPEQPTKDDAIQAAKTLLAPFSEFPFEDVLDTSILLAYLFTLTLRTQLITAPSFCISATTPGTGKGLLVECCNLIVRGRDAATMPPVTGMGKEEEARKRITSLLSMGVPSINIDNCTQPIGGESLNVLLTSHEWVDRRLGVSEMVRLPTRVTLVATGNNLTVKGDMTRRSLLLKLDAKEENPERRTFNDPNIVQTIVNQRRQLLSALFTIIKAYRLSSKEEIDVLGRFEDWSRAVCAPIVWLGYPNPILSQNRLKEEDPETDELFGILKLIHSIKQDSTFTCKGLIDDLCSPAALAFDNSGEAPSQYGSDRSELSAALKNVAGDDKSPLNSKRLGRYFTRYKGRPISGYVLRVRTQSPGTKAAKQYSVERNK